MAGVKAGLGKAMNKRDRALAKMTELNNKIKQVRERRNKEIEELERCYKLWEGHLEDAESAIQSLSPGYTIDDHD